MVEASKQPDNGAANVNQVLDLAVLYADLNRPTEALRVLQTFGSRRTSAYGQAVIEGIRYAVATQMHDAAEISRTETYLAAHQAEAPYIYINALAISGKWDELATIVMRKLQDPETRAGMLVRMQVYRQEPLTPFERRHPDTFKILCARDDVKAAVRMYGRIAKLNIYRPASL
jgi:hypothetical protein